MEDLKDIIVGKNFKWEGNLEDALKFCEDGLDFNPKYAPLWF
jgi:hypothetical protein